MPFSIESKYIWPELKPLNQRREQGKPFFFLTWCRRASAGPWWRTGSPRYSRDYACCSCRATTIQMSCSGTSWRRVTRCYPSRSPWNSSHGKYVKYWRRPANPSRRTTEHGPALLLDRFSFDQISESRQKIFERFCSQIAVFSIPHSHLAVLCLAIAHDEHVRDFL